jgi:hypothetical protein
LVAQVDNDVLAFDINDKGVDLGVFFDSRFYYRDLLGSNRPPVKVSCDRLF